VLFAAVGAVGIPVKDGLFSVANVPTLLAICAIVYAVVANCAVLVPSEAVGAVGIPVNAGLFSGAKLPPPPPISTPFTYIAVALMVPMPCAPPVAPAIVNPPTTGRDACRMPLTEKLRSPVALLDSPVPNLVAKEIPGTPTVPMAKFIGSVAIDTESNLVATAVEIFPNSISYAAPKIVLLGSVAGRKSLGVKNVV
jgi:hypothetical protein